MSGKIGTCTLKIKLKSPHKSRFQVNTMTSVGSARLRLFCLESLRLWLRRSASRPVVGAVEEEAEERAEDRG